jgi:hypothetical protein
MGVGISPRLCHDEYRRGRTSAIRFFATRVLDTGNSHRCVNAAGSGLLLLHTRGFDSCGNRGLQVRSFFVQARQLYNQHNKSLFGLRKSWDGHTRISWREHLVLGPTQMLPRSVMSLVLQCLTTNNLAPIAQYAVTHQWYIMMSSTTHVVWSIWR